MDVHDCKISGKTKIVSLLGNPVEHSLSPAMHNLSFRMLGIDAVYLAFSLKGDEAIDAAMKSMRLLENWCGSNVTMPFKQSVVQYLDELDESARLTHAVNVVSKNEKGMLVGYNTDGVGFWNNAFNHGFDVEGKHVVLLGCGGAGSAIAAQAALDGALQIDCFARSASNRFPSVCSLSDAVNETTQCSMVVHDFDDSLNMRKSLNNADILINSTSVGMGSKCGDLPIDPKLLDSHLLVADTVYFPRETALLEEARDRGCAVLGGLGMLLEQASESERIWFNVSMPCQAVSKSVFD